MFHFLAVPDGVWVTAQEITLDFILFCLHKGCGPSETSCPVDEMKTQREAIRTTMLCWAKNAGWVRAVATLWGRQDAASTDRRKCLLLMPVCRCQMQSPLHEIYITLWTHWPGEWVRYGCKSIIRFSWSSLLLIILWVSKDNLLLKHIC